MSQPLRIQRFPITGYEAAWRWQRETMAAVRDGAADTLALLQHPPVYTFGRRVTPQHLLADAPTLRQRGAEIVESDRGGDVTFHSPGQLIGYPILNLGRRGLGAVDYVRGIEETLIRVLERFGIAAERLPGRPGVWTASGKAGAIGLRIQGGVSCHGFALNVDNDLSWFDAIVPCGIEGAGVTSMQALGANPGIEAVSSAVADAFTAVFDYAPSESDVTDGREQRVPSEAREPLALGR